MIEKIETNAIVKILKTFFKNRNERAYVVGGFIRDCILNKPSADIDIVVNTGKAKEISIAFANEINGYFVELDSINNIYRVVFNDKKNYVDIADCVGKSIEDDLKRRDFTINALAYDINNSTIIDICGGQQDILNNLLQEVSEENLIEDPIRIFRAYRFKSTLGFEFSKNLKILLNKHAHLIENTAKERINVELIKLFGGENVVEALQLLDKNNVLELIIPEVKDIKKIPPNSHHHLCLFDHSLETVKHIQKYYELACTEVKEHLDSEFLGGQKRLVYLKFAAFLHDVGKPATWQIETGTGRHRFIKHDTEGAKIIAPRLKELKFSKKQISYIQKIIKNHIYPAGLVTTIDSGEKAYLRFFRKMEDEVIDIIAVAHADRLSALGPDITQEMVDANINGLQALLNFYIEQKNKLAPLPKLLDGKEIMNLLNIPASKKLGQIIEQLKEAQISSEVVTKEDAIRFVKSLGI